NYIVVWEDLRNGDADIYAARVTTEGEVVEADGIPVMVKEYGQVDPSVAYGGGQFLMSWTDYGVSNTRNLWVGRLQF
ncbi:MAG: hypothetical protein JRI55_07140, partial [Deltaproteobacteria bacterium]|nr:hypothetical protein [Deltaproteobacteria bacterium]